MIERQAAGPRLSIENHKSTIFNSRRRAAPRSHTIRIALLVGIGSSAGGDPYAPLRSLPGPASPGGRADPAGRAVAPLTRDRPRRGRLPRGRPPARADGAGRLSAGAR